MLVVSYNGILSWRFGSHEILVLIQVSNIITKDILSEEMVSQFLSNIFFLKIWSVTLLQRYSI